MGDWSNYCGEIGAICEDIAEKSEEADELRAGLFAANVRIEELRTVLQEILPLIDGTLRKEVDFPIPAAKVRKVLEGK